MTFRKGIKRGHIPKFEFTVRTVGEVLRKVEKARITLLDGAPDERANSKYH